MQANIVAISLFLVQSNTYIERDMHTYTNKPLKKKKAAIFAISRISSFQSNHGIARHFLRLLGHSNGEVRAVAQVALV